ncbi:hypothetical protein A6A07_32390 [Streptomyces sp. CB03911]|nr:hypothetical protein A6A07_32390 [Streptomyces sp. CB03911]
MSLRGVRGRQNGSRASADGISCARSEPVILPYFAPVDQRLSDRRRTAAGAARAGGASPALADGTRSGAGTRSVAGGGRTGTEPWGLL